MTLDRPTPVPPPIQIGDTTLHWGARTYVMGIVNVAPDSFSGDGIIDPDIARGRRAAKGRSLSAGVSPTPAVAGTRSSLSVDASANTDDGEPATAAA